MRHYGAGKAYFEERKYFEAVDEFKKAESVMPDHQLVPEVRSFVDRARRNLERHRKDSKDTQIRQLILEGQNLYAAKEYIRARDTWNKILVLDPYSREGNALVEKANNAIWLGAKRETEARKRIEEKARLLDVTRNHLAEPYPKFREKPELDMMSSKVAGQVSQVEARHLLGERASQKVSLDFKEADLRDVIKQLHDWTGINIVLDEAVLNTIEPVLTIYLSEVTFIEALEYIIKTKGLAYRIEKNVIFITTPERLEAGEKMETRIYHLRKGLAAHTEFSEEAMYTKRAAEEKAVAREQAIIRREITIKDILEKSVSWPEGSRITLMERNGSLIVTNTLSNLAILEDILKEFDKPPMQVMIESRFVEVGASALNELGIEWKLSSNWGLTSSSKGTKLRLDQGQVTEFPELGSNRFRKEQPDTTIDSLGSVDLTLSGILTTPQFEAVLHAIEQHEETNLLSSPKVTTLNGQEAVIKIVTEYIYPTAYKTTAAEYNSSGIKVKDATSTPEKFVTRDAGILLKVIPRVGMDRKMINLTIVPEVSKLAEWYDYGTEGTPYEQPFFESRKCITGIVINDGDTVVLGGLIRETTAHIRDKVPLLGDIPILGGLFRREYDRTEKKNLLIFVTAHIIGPSGEMDR